MRVTAIQLAIDDAQSRQDRLRQVLDLLDQTRGSHLVLLPELWPIGYFAFDRYAAHAEPMDGPLVSAMRQKAADLAIHLLMGSFVERDGDRLFNTCVMIGPDGNVLGSYRKMHLFGYESQEPTLLTRGEQVVVIATPWGTAGLSICYDLRFPELYRRQVESAADCLLIVSAWPVARTHAWRLLNQARALENLACVFSCNCAGSSAGRWLAGHSMFVDPGGHIIAEAGAGPQLLSAEIDLAQVSAARAELPCLRDRVLER